MKKIKIEILLHEINSPDELPKQDKDLVIEAKKAVQNSYSPYSEFSVGVALLLENGKIITGSNQENAAYPSGMCAERVAMYYANSQYPDVPVKAMAISAFYKNEYIDNPIPPCGGCRQVLLESELRFQKPIKLLLVGKTKILISENIKTLLPLNFDDSFLKL